MSEIKSAGIKGYAFLAGVIAIVLFWILVIYVYKLNGNFVPAEPERYSEVARELVAGFLA